MKKLAVITTHPIQYYAPLFRLIQERDRIALKVFYTWGEEGLHRDDPGFKRKVQWDIPLLDGYPYQWVRNTAARPGSDRFSGIVNPDLSSEILAWQPDAVMVIGWAYSGHLKAIRHLSQKVPLYFRGDSTLLNESNGLKDRFKYYFLRWVYRHFKHAFFVGTSNKAYFKRYGFPEQQLSFAPHAVDNERFALDRSAQVMELRRNLGISDRQVLVVYAGKFEPVKNVTLLLEAFIALENPAIHLLLAGNGKEEACLLNLAKNARLQSNIHFLGFQNQSFMPVIYQAADLFCLPSLSETWGLAVNEAMACGRAVLVSDRVGCAADLVLPGTNGSVFRSGKKADLIQQLDFLTRSRDLLKAYGAASTQIITNWNFTNIAAAIEKQML